MYGLEVTKQMLDRAVEDRGEDWVYPDAWRSGGKPEGTCMYATPDGQPGCIVGHVLNQVGLLLDEVRESGDVVNFLDCVQENFESEAAELLRSAQIDQDYGKPWGEAVNSAWELALRDLSELSS